MLRFRRRGRRPHAPWPPETISLITSDVIDSLKPWLSFCHWCAFSRASACASCAGRSLIALASIPMSGRDRVRVLFQMFEREVSIELRERDVNAA
jgi:hypothetical protein